MKNSIFILLIIIQSFASCNQPTKKNKQNFENKSQGSNPYLVNKNIKILEKLYVTKENGLSYRDKYNGKILGVLLYGEKVEIIEYSKNKNGKSKEEWVAIKHINAPHKVYVLKSYLGKGSEIKLLKENLNIVQGIYTPNSNTSFYESHQNLSVDNLLQIELISKGNFDELKKKCISHLNRDSTHVNRINDTLFIKNLKFIDNNIDRDDYTKYNYIGSIDFLNKYVLTRNLWENWDCIMVDKQTGKIDSENQKLIDLAMNIGSNRLGVPKVSPNKKYLVSLESALYTSQAELNLLKITNNSKLKFQFGLLFKHWSPGENEFYWISDSEFIINVFPINVIRDFENEEPISSNNYLKIRIN